MEWPAHYVQAIESNFDIHHGPFIHGNIFGRRATRVDPIEAMVDGDRIELRGTLRPTTATRGARFPSASTSSRCSMPRPRFERLDAEKRDAILDAAEAEFAAFGFARASYNRIIENAGVSKGAMYYYFDDKADLYLTVVRRVLGGLVGVMGEFPEVEDAEGFWAACGATVGRIGRYFMADPQRAELARGLVRSLADAPPQVREVLALAQQPTREILEIGQGVGAVRADLPVDLLAAMLLGLGEATDTWLATHWDSLPPGKFTAMEGQLMGVFMRVCAP